jgi:hypothetical protein
VRAIVDLGCDAPLTCRATLFSPRVEAGAVWAELEPDYGTRARHGDDQVAVQLVEPFELVALARALVDGRHRFSLRAFAAVGDALELLREPAEPMQTMWRWLTDTLLLELPDAVGAFVAGERTGYLELGDGFLESPVLILEHDGAREIVDRDHHVAGELELTREVGGWFVGSPGRHGRHSTAMGLHINGVAVRSPHPIQTGDRVSHVVYRRHYSICDVVAIV